MIAPYIREYQQNLVTDVIGYTAVAKVRMVPRVPLVVADLIGLGRL